jgi:hypothetical protein
MTARPTSPDNRRTDMKTSPVSFLRVARATMFLLAASAAGAAAAQAVPLAGDCTPRLSGMQQRLFDKSDEGPAALREFMFARRGILQLDIYETGMWADSIRESRAACIKELARMRTSPGPATRMATAGASAPAR